MMLPLLLVKVGLLFSLALWLTIAAINNIVDSGTNTHFLWEMMSMSSLREDGRLGKGLLNRASKRKESAHLVLKMVIVAQILIALSLFCAAILMILTTVGIDAGFAISFANLSTFAFMLLWWTFLCGGLWHVYWVKMGSCQAVHLNLLIISLLSLLVLNIPIH